MIEVTVERLDAQRCSESAYCSSPVAASPRSLIVRNVLHGESA